MQQKRMDQRQAYKSASAVSLASRGTYVDEARAIGGEDGRCGSGGDDDAPTAASGGNAAARRECSELRDGRVFERAQRRGGARRARQVVLPAEDVVDLQLVPEILCDE